MCTTACITATTTPLSPPPLASRIGNRPPPPAQCATQTPCPTPKICIRSRLMMSLMIYILFYALAGGFVFAYALFSFLFHDPLFCCFTTICICSRPLHLLFHDPRFMTSPSAGILDFVFVHPGISFLFSHDAGLPLYCLSFPLDDVYPNSLICSCSSIAYIL